MNKLIKLIELTKLPFGFYESPFRIINKLELWKNELGTERRIFVGRELTKIHETLYRGKISEVIQKLENDKIKAEIVIVADW